MYSFFIQSKEFTGTIHVRSHFFERFKDRLGNYMGKPFTREGLIKAFLEGYFRGVLDFGTISCDSFRQSKNTLTNGCTITTVIYTYSTPAEKLSRKYRKSYEKHFSETSAAAFKTLVKRCQNPKTRPGVKPYYTDVRIIRL